MSRVRNDQSLSIEMGKSRVEKMNVYLDTNVYSYLLEAREVRQARDYFRKIAATILVSDTVILETARVPKRNERQRRLKAVRTVSNVRIDPPTPYREAIEILNEIRRCRPTWLESKPDESMVKKCLRLNRRNWNDFKYNSLPDPAVGLPEYLRDAEPATNTFLAGQRQIRQALLQDEALEVRAGSSELQQYLESAGQTARYWRLQSAAVWARALNGHAAMRDYKDFLGPYLAGPIGREEWDLFWVRDVNDNAMPVGRLRSTIEFHQFTAKVSHGNPMDTDHGVHLADCDLLLTCDKEFSKVLNLVTQEGVPGARLGRPVLVSRRSGYSALEAIIGALEESANV